MSSSSMTTYIIHGLKISLAILQDVSDDLPAPASSIVNLVQRVIAVLEVRSHRATCPFVADLFCNRLFKVIERNANSSEPAYWSFCLSS